MTNDTFLSEECKVEIVVKQCLSILSYCVDMWRVVVEELRKCNVCFNTCFRRIFNYCKYESVKQVLLGFRVLSFDLFVLRARLILISNALKSNGDVLRKCAEIGKDNGNFLYLLNIYNIDYNLDKVKVHQEIWKIYRRRCSSIN